MHFDFNKQEKNIIKNIYDKIDSLNKIELTDQKALINLIDDFVLCGYFSCYASMLNLVRAKLSEKNFPLYFVFEVGKRLVKSLIEKSKSINQNDLLMATVAYIEENNNFSIENINTSLIEDTNFFVITGEKRYVPFLDLCNFVLILAKKENSPCICIVEKDKLKYEPVKNIFFDDINFFNIKLENCKLPKENIILYENDKKFLDTFFYELNKIAISGAMGLMNGAFNEATLFSKTHKNNEKPIIHYQEVGFKLAEMKTLLDASYLISSKANSMKNIDKEAMEIALVAKVFCLESLEKIASGAISILSIHGFFKDSYSHKAYMLAKFLQTLGSSIEVSRVELGDLLLGYKRH